MTTLADGCARVAFTAGFLDLFMRTATMKTEELCFRFCFFMLMPG
jgi:predicted patatin/cPLA2 family phospholipase